MDLVEEIVPLRDRELAVLRPRDAESLLDEEAFEREERMPYWAELWPSGVALARALAGRALGGRRVVELGCGGLALPSIAAALGGPRVLATDWSAEALALAERNAERNGAAIETAACAWERPAELVRRGPWDLVLAADVLYEQRNVSLLLELLPRLGGEVWLADPNRPALPEFLAGAAERGFAVSSTGAREPPGVGVHRLSRGPGAVGAPGRSPP
ncbi:MAG TPA: class I SAM-dependent methyltransferase [Solirubrobacteraceae bacterium]|nr:class I SAM-dependent methyltransferase [Solirubrobacteraceae bacterium]